MVLNLGQDLTFRQFIFKVDIHMFCQQFPVVMIFHDYLYNYSQTNIENNWNNTRQLLKELAQINKHQTYSCI